MGPRFVALNANATKNELASGCLLAAAIALSAVYPWRRLHAGLQSTTELLQGSNVPVGVQLLLAKKCVACHSETTFYPPYIRIAPSPWAIERDVLEGINLFEMSQW